MSKRRAPGKSPTTHKKQNQIVQARISKPSPLVFQPRPDWHTVELAAIPSVGKKQHHPPDLLEKYAQNAQKLLEAEALAYSNHQSNSSSSHKFLSTIMRSGTWDDKVSALTLLVQESPLHMQKPLENLLGIAGKRSRSTALMALGALKDLFGQGVVLPDRKLQSFHKQPSLVASLHSTSPYSSNDDLPNGVENKHMIYWAFEDWLKRKYFEMIQILETWCNDEVEFARTRAVTFVWELLKAKPEQEENLLRLLVNKLGDSSRKVASRASYLLLQLQVAHPSMRPVIIETIETEALLRPGQSFHAKYYAVITLNQTVLRIAEPQVAEKLLEVYFSMFVTVLNSSNKPSLIRKHKIKPTKQEVNKARKTDRLNEIGRSAKKQSSEEQEIDDKIVAQILTGVNRALPFSSKHSDTCEKHLDTLFRITHSANFNTGIQALVLIQQISVRSQVSSDRFYRTLYDSLLDPRLIRSSKHTMYLNLLYRSLKGDASLKRVKSFIKRLLQVLSLHEPPFICAALYLIGELQLIYPSISTLLVQPETLDDSTRSPVSIDTSKQLTGMAFERNPELGKDGVEHGNHQDLAFGPYDGRKRDPEYSNAHKTCLWELLPWQLHFHPSVSLFASRLLASLPMPQDKPDPSLHTLIHFLDRFAYSKARIRSEGSRGSSLMQPALANETNDTLFTSRNRGRLEQSLNSEDFWKKQIGEVEVDQAFFHTYFSQRNRRIPGKNDRLKEKAPAEVGVESGGESEDHIWEALVGSRPDIEGSNGSDSEIREPSSSDEEDGEMDDEMDIDHKYRQGVSDEEEDLPKLECDEDASFGSNEDGMSDIEVPQSLKEESRRRKRQKLKGLPTFASAEEYADMLDVPESEEEI